MWVIILVTYMYFIRYMRDEKLKVGWEQARATKYSCQVVWYIECYRWKELFGTTRPNILGSLTPIARFTRPIAMLTSFILRIQTDGMPLYIYRLFFSLLRIINFFQPGNLLCEKRCEECIQFEYPDGQNIGIVKHLWII